jgi:hypothetical protein
MFQNGSSAFLRYTCSLILLLLHLSLIIYLHLYLIMHYIYCIIYIITYNIYYLFIFLTMYYVDNDYGVHIQKWEKRDNNGEDESNWDTLYAYMEMLQCKSLYNYHKLIIFFFFFFCSTGFELRASHLLGRCSYHSTHSACPKMLKKK